MTFGKHTIRRRYDPYDGHALWVVGEARTRNRLIWIVSRSTFVAALEHASGLVDYGDTLDPFEDKPRLLTPIGWRRYEGRGLPVLWAFLWLCQLCDVRTADPAGHRRIYHSADSFAPRSAAEHLSAWRETS